VTQELEYPSHYNPSDMQLVYSHEEVVSSKEVKYTTMHNAIQPQPAAKLEPFSELLSVPYGQDYSAGHELFHHHQPTAYEETVVVTEELPPLPPAPAATEETAPAALDECSSENFGEIIKKSMAESVSA
jgi:hypothetical protein